MRKIWYKKPKTQDMLENENKALRELVAHIHTCLHLNELFNHDSCNYCPMHGDEHNCEFESRMKALGIEPKL